MAWFRRSSHFIILVLAVALTLGLAVNVPAQVQAQLSPPSLSSQLPNQSNFRPPRTPTGEPENTQGGATRGNCFANKDESAVALVPSASKIGETVAEYPTVSWYMPKARASAVNFVLKKADNKADNKEDNKEVYSFKYSLAQYTEKAADGSEQNFVVGTPGIMSLTVPSPTSISPIEIGKVYQWELTLMCDPVDQSAIFSIERRIKRVEPNPTLAPRLQQATPQERVTLYTEENLWYDAVATLVELGRDRPNDPNLAAIWDKLLTSQGL
jgi:hypothetical protein